MFERTHRRSSFAASLSIIGLIHLNTVRQIRKNHGNPLLGLMLNMMKTVTMVLIFYFMFSILGLKSSAIRGDFLLYIMSGIFLFLTHNNAMSSVIGSEGPTAAMMKHAPMNTIVSISSAALSSLYLQLLTMVLILFIYHVAFSPVAIDDPVGAFAMVLLAWLSGVAVGLLFLALNPWAPTLTGVFSTIYARANMITSGKMFVANQLPANLLVLFSWNPLFHTIDQARGFAFVNYTPHNSSAMYPVYVSAALIMVGLLGEFYTRQHASLSWQAGK
jgi:ABC-type polysaccharide/polyol phosphate export permease